MTTTPVTDSYLDTIEAADLIFASRLGATAWTLASASDKAKALQMATRVIDSLNFSGYKQSDMQVLQFPRMYRADPDYYSPYTTSPTFSIAGDCISEATPNDVLLACALEALALIEYYANTSPIDESDLIAKGVKSFSLGKLSMSFGGSQSLQSGFRSKEAFDLLEKYVDNTVLIT